MNTSQKAEETLRSVLTALWEGAPALRVDSPPGAGKTGLVERVAAQTLGVAHERCAVATTTNEQCLDLARRLAHGFPRLDFTLFVSGSLELPADVRALSNIRVATRPGELPAGPCVVLGNAAKWSWIEGDVPPFDVLVVDEAFQLPDYRFQLIAGLGRRILLVGDPGQIAPVIACEVERWRADPTGPHVPCPEALLARHPWVPRARLPVSRRLVADTVSIVQPAFYPTLPFEALTPAGGRALTLPRAGTTAVDRALDLLAGGASLAMTELPAAVTGETDDTLADVLAGCADRLLTRGARLRDEHGERAMTAADVGVVCAHVSQVNAVRARLAPTCGDVLVETAERWQGLERAVMLVHHPLSGRASLSGFALDAGRLCVMTTRHRAACLLVTRAGLDERLVRYAPTGERVLGRARDDEFEGWRAHRAIVAALRARERAVAVK